MPEPSFSYTFDERLNNGRGAYRDQRGRIVSQNAVRTALDRYVDNAVEDARKIGGLLRGGQINVKEWEFAMRQHIKNVHIVAAVSAEGGRDQMTFSKWGRVGQRIKEQYNKYLAPFAQQIADGKIPLDGRFLVRSQLYTEAAITTHDIFNRANMERAGYDEEANELDPGARHCSGIGSCEGETDRGWVPIGSLIPIGQRKCLGRCRCTVNYRNSETGVVIT